MLGAWLVKALLDRGDEVVVLRRDDVQRSALIIEGTEARCAVGHGDITDALVVDRAIGEYEVDAVFHLAAQTIVGTATRSPLSTFESNIRGTWVLLEACREHGVARTVVAASDKAYGPTDQLPYTEEHPLQPLYPYDVSKACTDLIARSYWPTYELPVAVTRFANIYGGGDLNPSRLVPEAVAAVLEGRAPVIRSDGTPERDFLYVEDAAAAYLAIERALEEEDAGARGEAFNAGGGRPVSVREVVETLERVAGAPLGATFDPARELSGEISRQYVDIAKIGRVCGWAPQVSLEEGLKRTLAWYREHRA